MRQQNMAMSPARIGTKNDLADEDQQQLSGLSWTGQDIGCPHELVARVSES
jgi:hypothetical protein